MQIRVPEYFVRFRCIADKCLDSCCIGWEIDVDDDAKAKYAALDTPLGREIVEKTSHGCFPLKKDGRCAFLDDKGLCRIISALGDGYLCDICREHPRYYGVGNGIFDGGLGLGCEEAARMILELNELPRLVTIERDIPYYDEDELAKVSEDVRTALFSHIFKDEIRELAGIYKEYARIGDDLAFEASTSATAPVVPDIRVNVIDSSDLKSIYEEFIDLVGECEALSDDWADIIERVKDISADEALGLLDGKRGLFYYFTHRYVREGAIDMSLGQRVLFSLGSALVISAISTLIGSDIRAAVLYSKNIEYSTDNVEYILENIGVL